MVENALNMPKLSNGIVAFWVNPKKINKPQAHACGAKRRARKTNPCAAEPQEGSVSRVEKDSTQKGFPNRTKEFMKNEV